MTLTNILNLALLAVFPLSAFTLDGQTINTPLFQMRTANTSYLGVNLADVDAEIAKESRMPELTGAEIVSVMEDSPAHRAGLKAKDVVLSYNGENVLGREQLARLVMETPPGRRVTLVYWRAGTKEQVSVTTGTMRIANEMTMMIHPAPAIDVPSTLMIWRNSMIGIESESISEQLAQAFGVKQGVLIWNVAAGSPAQHAGLRAGDILTDFCGRNVHSPREVGFALHQVQSGQQNLTLSVMRDHKPISLSISLENVEH